MSQEMKRKRESREHLVVWPIRTGQGGTTFYNSLEDIWCPSNDDTESRLGVLDYVTFLSLITGKSDVQHYVFYLSPQETNFLSLKFKLKPVAGTWRQSPLWRSLTYLTSGLLCPTAHKGVKSCHSVFHRVAELLLPSSLKHLGFTLYLSPWPCHLGH